MTLLHTCRFNILVQILLIHVCFQNTTAAGENKETKVSEFIAKEIKVLEKLGSCSLKQLIKNSVHSLWLKEQSSDNTVLCILKFLDTNRQDGKVWSLLGTSFEQRHLKKQTDFCFQQAVKFMGKYERFIKKWWFIGPFVIGKTEFDGDALAAYGGIQNVSRFRLDSEPSTFFSELVSDGVVKWREVEQIKDQEMITVNPKIDWNDLVNSLGSMAITEWQGWMVGELFIGENDLQLSYQCLGVAKCLVGETWIAGDLYHRNQFWFPVSLSRGVHSILIPLRTKVAANFKFAISKMSAFQVLEPSFLPDLYKGYLPINSYLSVPVSNLMSSKWLKITTVKVINKADGEPLVPVLVNNIYDIAPGQIRPVVIQLTTENTSEDTRVSKMCTDIDLELKLFTNEGAESFYLTLHCRSQGSSFLFTFIDHDGSVQHAAAIEPLGVCESKACPVLLTLHGTTVAPRNQADSYKRMVEREFQFGVESMWLLAPTRHGAHNWEGPGALTAMTALKALHTMTVATEWFKVKADPMKVVFAGHSMGGHGAWHLATHFPDRVIGLISLAGWIKKEEYGDSNLFFRHDISTSHTDPAVKAIMEACVGENDADKHVTNLKGIPVLARIGGNDRTVHPFFVRRMVRLLKEARIDVTYSELPNLGHWWWDTSETNDGGCVNDAQVRKFIAQITAPSDQSEFCSVKNEECGTELNMHQGSQQEPVTLVTVNPALGEGLKGVSVLQQIIPFRISKVQISINEDTLTLRTQNIKCLQIKDDVQNRAIDYQGISNIAIDGSTIELQMRKFPYILCITGTLSETGQEWELLPDLYLESNSELQRGPHNYGPARRIAEQEFIIVVGTMGNKSTTHMLLRHAVYIANHFLLTSDTSVQIVNDINLDNTKKVESKMTASNGIKTLNLILVGSPQENLFTGQYLNYLPDLKFQNSTDQTRGKLQLGDLCVYQEPQTGILTLAPNNQDKLALILMGLSIQGLEDIVNLATPTIPPMARSPFSNLLPDFVITGPDVKQKGPGGFLCTGFWNNNWRFSAASSSCTCKIN